jgi:hypothetical protein
LVWAAQPETSQPPAFISERPLLQLKKICQTSPVENFKPLLSNTPMAFVLSEKRKTISAIPGDTLAAV